MSGGRESVSNEFKRTCGLNSFTTTIPISRCEWGVVNHAGCARCYSSGVRAIYHNFSGVIWTWPSFHQPTCPIWLLVWSLFTDSGCMTCALVYIYSSFSYQFVFLTPCTAHSWMFFFSSLPYSPPQFCSQILSQKWRSAYEIDPRNHRVRGFLIFLLCWVTYSQGYN